MQKGSNGLGSKGAHHPNYFLKMANGRLRGEPIFAIELPPSTGTANARLVTAEVRASGAFDAPILYSNEKHSAFVLPSKMRCTPVKYIMFKGGRLLLLGDHVVVQGTDENVYYAIVNDFWMDPSGQKWVKLQWLLPKISFSLQIDGPKESLDPSFFTLGKRWMMTDCASDLLVGPMHTQMERIESLIDVFFSPQRLQRPLDNSLVSHNRDFDDESSSSISRRSSVDRAFPDHLSMLINGSATSSSPVSADGKQQQQLSLHIKRVHSDGELEIKKKRRKIVHTDNVADLLTSETPLSIVQQRNNIMDDVELAHLLCNIIE